LPDLPGHRSGHGLAGQLCLPVRKLLQLKHQLTHYLHRKAITKQELERLTGLLQFANKVICPVWSFLRQLYVMQSIGSQPHHNVSLNSAARADITWWYLFAAHWNGIFMLWDSYTHQPGFTVFSNASGSWGCGAFWNTQWFYLHWFLHFWPQSIAVKELVPVIVAAALLGSQWIRYLIQFSVDNMNVVHVF